VVCLALADGDDLPGSAATPGHGDAAAVVVGAGDPKNHTGAVGVVLAHHPVRSPANGVEEHGGRPTSGMVPQASPNLLRRFGAGTPGVVGTRNFSRVAAGAGHGKSPAGVCGAPNRNALLRGLIG
jgi:hypothetical protein